MNDIYLSLNNREEQIQLPVIPKRFKINSPVKSKKYETIAQGEIKLIGLRGLKSLIIESFFPAKDYPFLRDKTYKSWEYVEKIEKWRDERIPFRLIITNTNINMPVTIENFEYGIQDGTGDIYYSLKLEEFKFIELERKKA